MAGGDDNDRSTGIGGPAGRTLDWTFTAATFPGSWAPPGYGTDAQGRHVVVFGSKDNDDAVYSVNATTGKLWHSLSGIVVAAPSVSGPAGHKVAFIGGTKGNLFGLSVATGATLWTSPGTSAGYYASPPVSRGRVFDVDLNGTLTSYALPAARHG